MTRNLTFALSAVTALVTTACAPNDRPAIITTSAVAAQPAANAEPQVAAVRYVVAPAGNEARYRIREQLAGLDLPNDAIGATSAITGSIAFDAKGNVIPSESKIVVDVSGLKSDKDRRDNYVRSRLLQTAQFQSVTLVPTVVKGLGSSVPASGTRKIELVGNLTVRDTTRSTTWRGEATFSKGKVTGKVTTSFTFAEYGLTKPRVPVVLSVEDTITLEYDFTLVPASAEN